jgi:glycosyltransferase involved in cell wall biosynthesis
LLDPDYNTGPRMSEAARSSEPAAGVFLSVIIPAFDEASRIGSTVERVQDCLASRAYTSELIIVLDGGRPGGAEAIARIPRGRPDVVVLDNGRNRGKGYSVRRGMLTSRGTYVLFLDADLSLPIEDADRFIAALVAGADLAIGSRALPASSVRGERQPLRQVLGRVFNWVVQRAVLPGLQDTQCGFKAFRGAIGRTLFRAQRIDRFGFDVEVLRLARRSGYRIVEVPVTCEYGPSSSVRRLRDGVSMLRDLVAILWHDWRGRHVESD